MESILSAVSWLWVCWNRLLCLFGHHAWINRGSWPRSYYLCEWCEKEPQDAP